MKDDPHSRQNAKDAGQRLVSGHASEDPFAAAFKATRMPMLITDPRQPDNPIIFCNTAFCILTGYAVEELVGRNCRLLQGPQTDSAAVDRLRDAVASERDISIDILNYRKDGTKFWNALFVSPVRDVSGVVIYFFASQLDFTNKEQGGRTRPRATSRRGRSGEENGGFDRSPARQNRVGP